MRSETIPVLVIFICETHLKWLRQLRNISGFYLRKFQKASRMILASSKNYQACAETNLTYWCIPKQLFGIIETYPMTSLCGTIPLSETFRCPKLFR